jgi:transcriptional regulator with XRE-family HTH domain
MKERIEAEGAAAPETGAPEEDLSQMQAILGRNLRARRAGRWMSRKALVERTGIPAARIAAIEAGRCNPSIDELTTLAAILEMPLWMLLKP